MFVPALEKQYFTIDMWMPEGTNIDETDNISGAMADYVRNHDGVEMVIAFTLLGVATIHISEWVNNRYMQDSEGQWRFMAVNVLVAALFLALNYGMCVIAKILADVKPVWALSSSGWRLLVVLWMAEMAIIL